MTKETQTEKKMSQHDLDLIAKANSMCRYDYLEVRRMAEEAESDEAYNKIYDISLELEWLREETL